MLLAKDGSFIHVPASQVRDKGLHIPDFLDSETLDDKFDSFTLFSLVPEYNFDPDNPNVNRESSDQCQDSSYSQPSKKRKKNNIEVKIIDDQIILRVTRDGMPFFIDEMTARKKIYQAPDFGVALPDNLNLEYVKSLSTKDRLEYLSDSGILPQKCVGEYLKKLAQHLLDPTINIEVGTLGKNGATKGWGEPIPGKHAFNSDTGNDVFFTDDGFKFHTGMNLNDGQLINLDDNKNIL